jgi:hypothetical protein
LGTTDDRRRVLGALIDTVGHNKLAHQLLNRSSGSNHTTKESTKMKKFGFATVAASGLAAAILGLAAPADAAPAGPGNAQDTVKALQAEGYHVIVNKLGSAPLDQSTVIAVRPGQTYSRTDSGVPGAGNDLVTTVTDKTVYVDVK